jgi:ketosteroid isomerase-like protein
MKLSFFPFLNKCGWAFLLFLQMGLAQAQTMNNSEIIKSFYEAFQRKDYATMQSLYAPNAVFNDPAFPNLNGYKAGKMWEMLLTRGKDLVLTFEVKESTDSTAKAVWIAHYTFSATKRKVVNHIEANFVLENGKIIRHTDHFKFYKWARQATGAVGWLLGWTRFFKRKVQKTALQSLEEYIQKNP